MYSSIVQVTPTKDFSLEVVFDDGQKRSLDMRPYLNFGVFRQLQEPEKFSQVHIAFDTVEWDCGVDLDPEFVMSKSLPL